MAPQAHLEAIPEQVQSTAKCAPSPCPKGKKKERRRKFQYPSSISLGIRSLAVSNRFWENEVSDIDKKNKSNKTGSQTIRCKDKTALQASAPLLKPTE